MSRADQGLRSVQHDTQRADHATARRNARRAREFYRYLHPDHILNSAQESPAYHLDKIPNLSQTFLPHCQLTTWRCKAKKAMVNFMDRDVMYFVSESSVKKTIIDGEEHVDFVEDPILASCTSAPLEGKICELVLHMDPKQDERPPMFVIPNLAESPFSHMPIISGPPYYRFYAGTPIKTRQGVSIGSLAIMDDQPRQCLTREQEDFMAATANQIMSQLESHRQAVEGSRALRMTAALQAFFTNTSVPSATSQQPNPSISSAPTPNATYCVPRNGLGPKERNESTNGLRRNHRSTAPRASPYLISESKSISDTQVPISASESRSRILKRAAILIQECLDSADNSTVTVFGLGKNPLNTPDSKPLKSTRTDEFRRTQQSLRRPARISARVAPAAARPTNGNQSHSTTVDEEFLRLLATNYPEGRLWNLNDDESDTSNDDSIGPIDQIDPSAQDIGSQRCRGETEHQNVKAAFPSAHQVLFIPLWDADSALASYCLFVESDNEVHSFSASTDLSFLRTFCSSITTEISKMEAVLMNKQKSDFVGTISHELRSPLHGILGSAEFLADTELTNFQHSLVKTIESCGNTLLDTISHILDYSKINSFENQWPGSKEKGTATQEQRDLGAIGVFDEGTATGASPLSQAAINTDMAAILEEVIDSLVRARTYTQNIDLTDISPKADGIPDRFTSKQHTEQYGLVHPEVFIDIEPVAWLFLTHPGAVKRIFMNVAGNALKFTSNGTITISLALKASSTDDQTSTMVFEVADTGPGISPEFLDSKLFLPFSQENALSPGTGLGLSIVYNIVKMLGGWVDVKSTAGQGTTVRVELPLQRANSLRKMGNKAGYRPYATSTTSIDSIAAIRNNTSNIHVALYPLTRNDTERRIMAKYVNDWCQLRTCHVVEDATVVIVDEKDLDDFVQTYNHLNSQSRVILMCSETDKNRILRNQNSLRSRLKGFECVTKPCGPRKLARALRLVLDKSLVDNLPTAHRQDKQVNAWLKDSTFESSDFDTTRNLTNLDNNASDSLGAIRRKSALDKKTVDFLGQLTKMTLQPASTAVHSASNTTPQESNVHPLLNGEGKDNATIVISAQEQPPSSPPKTTTALQQQENGIETPRPILTSTLKRESTMPDIVASPRDFNPQRQPRVLLVDDNKVNLRLLETYLRKKRQYTDLTKAEDGQQAVDAFVASSSPSSATESAGKQDSYDLIFMDISMPVMDGFTATRAIRQHEALRTPQTELPDSMQLGDGLRKRNGVFIIAMTGLASAKDQTEGYESGCDVYMTKPVSFKEVSKLLDQWEMTQHATIQNGTTTASIPITS